MKFIFNSFTFLLLICVTIFSSLTWAKEAPQKLQPLTLILDWFPNPDQAPLFVAAQQGFFKQEGLDVKFISPADPSDPAKLVAAGKADLAITYQPQLAIQVDQGLPLVRIATLIATPLNCLMVRGDSAIKTISDLKGKTIGYSSGAIDLATLRVILKMHGLSLKNVHPVNVRYNLTQALLTKNVDAVIGVMRNFEMFEMQLAHHPARAFYIEENGFPAYDELIIVSNRKTVHDPRLPKFIAALNLGVQYLVNHPEKSWELFSKNHPELNNTLNKEAWFATLPRFALRPAALDDSRYENLENFLYQQGVIKKLLPVKDYAVSIKYINNGLKID
jgi:putative hydroxymethylpyrimidine transport system substrate-binding protein